MDPIQLATDLVTDNAGVAVALVTGLFAVTIIPTLAMIGLRKAARSLVMVAGGSSSDAAMLTGGSDYRYGNGGPGFSYTPDGRPHLSFDEEDDEYSRRMSRRAYKAARWRGSSRSEAKEQAAEFRGDYLYERPARGSF